MSRDVLLQLLASIARPLLFTLAVLELRGQAGQEGLLEFVGYLAMFAVGDAITQSYARASTRYIDLPRFWVIVAVNLGISLLILGQGLIRHGSAQAVLVIGALYTAHSLLLLHEHELSQRRCVLMVSGVELCLMLLVAGGLLLSSPQQTPGLLYALAFSTFSASRLAGWLLQRAARHFSRPEALSSPQPTAQPGRGALTFMGSSVSLQLVGALSASAAVIYNTLSPDPAAYALSLVALRWVHTIGALASTVVNVFGSRVFYGSMDITRFSQAAGFFVRRRQAVQAGAVVLPLLMGLALLAPEAKANDLVSLAACTAVVSFVNYLSSTAFSFGEPRLSLLCQLMVLLCSLIVCGLMHHAVAPVAGLVVALAASLHLVTSRVLLVFSRLP